MASHARDAGELLSPVGQQARQFARRHWRPLVVVLAAALAIAIALLQPTGEAAERRALQNMPPAERQALYDEMLRSTESLCTQSATNAALHGRCVHSARFLVAFPECDDACRRLARAHQPGPTR